MVGSEAMSLFLRLPAEKPETGFLWKLQHGYFNVKELGSGLFMVVPRLPCSVAARGAPAFGSPRAGGFLVNRSWSLRPGTAGCNSGEGTGLFVRRWPGKPACARNAPRETKFQAVLGWRLLF
jgi:hypothetical protein